MVAIEAKNRSWAEIFGQCCVYARALFENPSRSFVPAIGYRQNETTMRFFFYTRAGVFVTDDLNIMI